MAELPKDKSTLVLLGLFIPACEDGSPRARRKGVRKGASCEVGSYLGTDLLLREREVGCE